MAAVREESGKKVGGGPGVDLGTFFRKKR